MAKLVSLAVLLLAAALPPSVRAQIGYSDNFDGYATGSLIAGQGGWETWDNDPAANTIVTNAKFFSPPNSLLIAGPADIVHQFVGVAGEWDLYANVYIPSTQTGEVWIRIANTYAPGGPYNFSVRLLMCVSACTTPGALPGRAVNMGGTEVPGAGSAPLVTDQWVRVHVVINSSPGFGYNYLLTYNGASLGGFLPWGVNAPGVVRAVDFLSNNSTPSYVDDFDLVPFVPVELISFTVA